MEGLFMILQYGKKKVALYMYLIDLAVKLFKSTKPINAILPALCKQLFSHVKGICHALGQYLAVQQSHHSCYCITMTIIVITTYATFSHY